MARGTLLTRPGEGTQVTLELPWRKDAASTSEAHDSRGIPWRIAIPAEVRCEYVGTKATTIPTWKPICTQSGLSRPL